MDTSLFTNYSRNIKDSKVNQKISFSTIQSNYTQDNQSNNSANKSLHIQKFKKLKSYDFNNFNFKLQNSNTINNSFANKISQINKRCSTSIDSMNLNKTISSVKKSNRLKSSNFLKKNENKEFINQRKKTLEKGVLNNMKNSKNLNSKINDYSSNTKTGNKTNSISNQLNNQDIKFFDDIAKKIKKVMTEKANKNKKTTISGNDELSCYIEINKLMNLVANSLHTTNPYKKILKPYIECYQDLLNLTSKNRFNYEQKPTTTSSSNSKITSITNSKKIINTNKIQVNTTKTKSNNKSLGFNNDRNITLNGKNKIPTNMNSKMISYNNLIKSIDLGKNSKDKDQSLNLNETVITSGNTFGESKMSLLLNEKDLEGLSDKKVIHDKINEVVSLKTPMNNKTINLTQNSVKTDKIKQINNIKSIEKKPENIKNQLNVSKYKSHNFNTNVSNKQPISAFSAFKKDLRENGKPDKKKENSIQYFEITEERKEEINKALIDDPEAMYFIDKVKLRSSSQKPYELVPKLNFEFTHWVGKNVKK